MNVVKTFLVVVAITMPGYLSAQISLTEKDRVFFKNRVEYNLTYMVKDSSILNKIEIQGNGIRMFDNTIYPEMRLYWDEVPKFIGYSQGMDYYKLKSFYQNKGGQYLFLKEEDADMYEYYHPHPPTDFYGLRVAIDPGHIAGNIKEAIYEKKYLIFGEDSVFEARLTYATAAILKDTLEKLGAEVLLTRNERTGAVGIPFQKWYREDFKKDLDTYVALGDVSPQEAKKLRETDSKYYVFETFYTYLDFVSRSRKINAFHPDVTFIIHYNSDESNHRVEGRNTVPVDANYSMCFVPGAFAFGELKKIDYRIDFIRLLVSNNIEESQKLAKYWIEEHEKIGIPPIPADNDLIHVRKYCIAAPNGEGIYSRNLYLTRAIKSPVVYGESLYQDNKTEKDLLLKKDFMLGDITTSKRVAEVAYAYLNTLRRWLEDNKKNEDNE